MKGFVLLTNMERLYNSHHNAKIRGSPADRATKLLSYFAFLLQIYCKEYSYAAVLNVVPDEFCRRSDSCKVFRQLNVCMTRTEYREPAGETVCLDLCVCMCSLSIYNICIYLFMSILAVGRLMNEPTNEQVNLHHNNLIVA